MNEAGNTRNSCSETAPRRKSPALSLLAWLKGCTSLTDQEREIVLNAYYALRELEGGSPLHPQHVERLRAFTETMNR